MSKLAHQNECKTCGRIFPLESHRTDHERRNHAQIPYMCRTCNWFYEDFTSLQYHFHGKHNFWPSVESSGLYSTLVDETQASNGDKEHRNRSESAQVNLVDSTSRIEVIVLSDDDSGSETDSEQDIFGGKENQHISKKCSKGSSGRDAFLVEGNSDRDAFLEKEILSTKKTPVDKNQSGNAGTTLRVKEEVDDTNSEDRSDATHIQLQLHSSMQLTERPNSSAQETNSFSLASARENNSGHAGSIANDDMGIEKEQALPEDFKENSTELRLQNSAGHDHVKETPANDLPIGSSPLPVQETMPQRNRRTFACRVCKKRFSERAAFVQHKHFTPISDERRYKCKICSKGFMWLGNFAKHTVAHGVHKNKRKMQQERSTTKNNKPDKSVGYRTTRRRRSNKRHTQCSICSRKFKSRDNRDEHVRRHKWMVYNCRVCDAMFEDFHYLTVHCRDNHPTERPKATDKENYKIKVSAANTETGTQSNQETLPQENIYSATKIIKRKQKSCNICSNCPGYRSNAGGKRVHTAKARISDLICKFCGRRFRTIFFKNEHEAQHEKMIYRCPGRCGYMFIHFKKLQWHCKFSHGSNLKRSDEERCKILAKRIAENKNSQTQDHPSLDSESQKVDLDQVTLGCPFEGCKFQYKTFDVLVNHAMQNHRKEQERGEQTASFKRRKVSANSAEIAPIPVTQKLVGKRTYWPKCNICQRLFRGAADRNYHEQSHHLMQYRCPHPGCGFMFERFETMCGHSLRYHNLRLGSKDVQRCKKNHGDQSSSVTKQSRADSAGLCDLNIASKAKQMGQVGTRKRPNGMPKCQFCNRCFKARIDRDDHEKQHEFMRYKCPYVGCNQLFLNFWLLSAHHGNRHERCLSKSEEVNCRIHQRQNVHGDLPNRSLVPDESSSLPVQSASSVGRMKSTAKIAENSADCEELSAEEEPEDFTWETSRAITMAGGNDVSDQIVTLRHQPMSNCVTVPGGIVQSSKMATEAASKQATATSKGTTTRQGSFSQDEYLYNAQSTISSSVSASDVSEVSATDDDDDHAEFYQAVTHRLCRLDAESRSLAALQVMKILHFAEFNSSFNVPRVHTGVRNAKQSTDTHCVEDITLCKKKIDHVLKRLSAERRQKAKCDILQMLVISFV